MKELEPGLPGHPEVSMFPSRSFYLDPKKQEFIVGNSNTSQIIKLSDVNDIFEIERQSWQVEADIGIDTLEMLLITPMGSLVVMPPLRKWLNNLSSREKGEVSRKAEDAIVSTYKAINPRIKISKYQLHHYDAHAISVFIYDHGIFTVQTLGEYAVLGMNSQLQLPAINYRDPKLREAGESDISLPAEYSLHNADLPEQRLSLYAGIGTIAWLAKTASSS